MVSISVPLVLEYEAVAKRQARELGLTFADVDDVLDYICSVADHRAIFYLWRPFLPDPTDDLLLELAVEAGADYIVTHNLRDFTGADQFGGFSPASPGGPMSSISLRLPESLHKQARELAAREDISINQLIATALAEKMAALMTGEYLSERAARGSRTKFEHALKKVRERRQPPIAGDEL